MSKKVLELVRVSTEGQLDRAGIPAQREINRRTAKAYALDIVRTVQIVDVSGSSVLRSPEMAELLRLMEDPEIHGVVTREFSRLMRPENFNDYALLQHFIDTCTTLYLPEGPIDFASKSGRLLGAVRAAIAGLERREIIERMMDAKETMRRAGKHPGGINSLPYGVGYSKERGWHYTPEVEKVKKGFALFLSAETSYTEIGRQLNLPRTNVRFILENPIYTGWRVWDEKRDPSASGYISRPDGRQGYRRKIKRAPDEVIRTRVLEPLVSEDQFERVQQLIEMKREKHWRAKAEAPRRYLYNGFLTCGDCTSLIYTHTSNNQWYHCKSRHPRERRKRALLGLGPCSNRHMLRRVLEPRIDQLLARRLTDREFLARVVDGYNSQVERSDGRRPIDTDAVERQLQTLQEKKQRVLETYFEGLIEKAERDRRLSDIEREILSYQGLLSESGPTPADERKPLDAYEVAAVVAPFLEWEFLTREDRRALLALLCPEITVYRYQIKGFRLNLGSCYEGSRSKTAW